MQEGSSLAFADDVVYVSGISALGFSSDAVAGWVNMVRVSD